MSSFIRQLNMYGFHKISSENGGMDCDKDEIKFFHPFFQQDQPNLMKHIKRKIASSKQSTTTGEENKVNNVDQISKVLVDVKQLRGRQESVDSQLAAMKQENAALWRELALLRQKHMKQQQIVNKLIHFLVTIVQPSRTGLGGLGVKRRYPLMINDARYSKAAKSDTNFDGPTIHELDAESALLNEVAANHETAKSNQVRIDSPPSVNSLIESENVLLDIPIEEAENLTEEALNNDILIVPDGEIEASELIQAAPSENLATVANLLSNTEIPLSVAGEDVSNDNDLTLADKEILRVAEQIANKDIEEPLFEDVKPIQIMKDAMISNLNLGEELDKSKENENNKSLTVATRNIPDLSNFKMNSVNGIYSDDLDSHLEATQGELDSIKDMLFEGYSLDANALLGNQISNPFDAVPFQLFNPDEEFALDIPPLTNLNENEQSKNQTNDPMMSGSELTTYVNQPFFLDFENLFEDSSDNQNTSAPEPSSDLEINTPVVVKTEPIYPDAKHTNTE